MSHMAEAFKQTFAPAYQHLPVLTNRYVQTLSRKLY